MLHDFIEFLAACKSNCTHTDFTLTPSAYRPPSYDRGAPCWRSEQPRSGFPPICLSVSRRDQHQALPALGHFGITKTLRRLRKRVYWPRCRKHCAPLRRVHSQERTYPAFTGTTAGFLLFGVGVTWVYFPMWRKGLFPKLISHWVGPCTLLGQLSEVDYRVCLAGRAQVVVVLPSFQAICDLYYNINDHHYIFYLSIVCPCAVAIDTLMCQHMNVSFMYPELLSPSDQSDSSRRSVRAVFPITNCLACHHSNVAARVSVPLV